MTTETLISRQDAERAGVRPAPAASSFTGDSANLDLIRAVAVLCVVFGHLRYLTHADMMTAWHFAQMGVGIFFVHTSMVLMLSLQRAERRGESLFGDFYIRRLFRLMPLAVFCISVMFFFIGPGEWSWAEYIANITMTMNLAYMPTIIPLTWTLAIELQMYIVLPLLFLLCCNRPPWMLLGIWALAVAAGAVQPYVSGRLTVLHYAPCFIGGLIAWRLSLQQRRILPGWLWPLAFLAVWPLFQVADQPHNLYYRAGFCLALGLIIPWFQEMQLGIVNKAARFVAKYSYGIYLTHPTMLMFAFTRPLPYAAQMTLMVACMIGVPVLLYHLIEHPMIRLGQRLTSGRVHRSQSETAW